MSPDPSRELKRAKREVRRRVGALRDALSEAERWERGGRAVERLLELPEVRAARTVMAFWSFGSEVPTQPLIAALHARDVLVALPRIVDGDIAALAYVPGDATTTTAFGAREPSADADPIAPSTIDVVVTPGLAFDRIGHRVGYGGGFFDRFLRSAAPAAFRAGLAFAVQVQDAELPAGHADTRVHAVVTELEVIRCPEEPVADLDRGSTTRYNAVGPPGAAMDPPDDRRDAV